MKIEIWSDFTCPFCYIGKKHLALALEHYPEQKADIIFHSYELNPEKSLNSGETIVESLTKSKGMSEQEVREMGEQITKMATEVGLPFHFEKIIPTNTFTAHRLSHYAKTQGKQQQLADALFKAHLVDGLDIGKTDVLLELALSVGLDKDFTKEVLAGESFTKEVREDEKESVLLGIQSVPFFLFEEQYALSGAQPVQVFRAVIKRFSK